MAGSSQSDPYVESPFERIVDVHWKKKPPPQQTGLGTARFSDAGVISGAGPLQVAIFQVQSASGTVFDEGQWLGPGGAGPFSLDLTATLEATSGTLTAQVLVWDYATHEIYLEGPILTATPSAPSSGSASAGSLMLAAGGLGPSIGWISPGSGAFGGWQFEGCILTVTQFSA